MSITNSEADIAAAKARLAEQADERLLADLGYWTVVAQDHQAEYVALTRQQVRLREQYAEAEGWVGLIGGEIRRRRDARREAGG